MLFGFGFFVRLFVLNTGGCKSHTTQYCTRAFQRRKKPFCLSLPYCTSSIDLML